MRIPERQKNNKREKVENMINEGCCKTIFIRKKEGCKKCHKSSKQLQTVKTQIYINDGNMIYFQELN